MPPKISVVLPVRNGENFLEHALRSVLEQDFQDFELLVGINPSTDATVSIAKAVLGSKHRGILVFKDEVSMPANFNRTALHATGEYIKFLCHDDLLNPNSLRTLYSEFLQNPKIALATSYESFLNSQRLSRAENSLGSERYVNGIRSIYRFSKYGNWLGGPSGVMVKKELFHKILFDESLRCAFDLDCWIKFSQHGGIGIVPLELYRSRVHENQETNVCNQGGFTADLQTIRKNNIKSRNFMLKAIFRFCR